MKLTAPPHALFNAPAKLLSLLGHGAAVMVQLHVKARAAAPAATANSP